MIAKRNGDNEAVVFIYDDEDSPYIKVKAHKWYRMTEMTVSVGHPDFIEDIMLFYDVMELDMEPKRALQQCVGRARLMFMDIADKLEDLEIGDDDNDE